MPGKMPFVSMPISNGKVILKPTAVFMVCFLSAIVIGEASILAWGPDIFGSVIRLPAHYRDHPHIFWLLQSLVFGLVATAWWQTFSRSSAIVRATTAVSAVWFAVLSAAFPCSLLWMLIEFSPVDISSHRFFGLMPQGFEAAIILYLTSVPFNIVATVAAATLLYFLPPSSYSVSKQSLAYFRTSQSTSAAWNLTKTVAQTAVFWFAFLYLIPQMLLAFERFFGIETFQFAAQTFVAGTGFVLSSAGGLWSGATMAVRGSGTPLPFDTAAKLVIVGPYKFVRNPMALFGLAQGLFVGIYLGSYFIFPYVLLGAWLWNSFVRPVEEAELQLRFGAAYNAYRREVSCWRIRIKE
jgi:protein-S-isoprenylcysteine O-methyltransferase Ste14